VNVRISDMSGAQDSTDVMSGMVGQWKLEKRDPNFGSFLACRQVGWLMRTLMTTTSADVEYQLSQDLETFTKLTTTYGGRTSRYPMPTKGTFIPDKTLSGLKETGKIYEWDSKMVQEMTFAESGDKAAVLKHSLTADGKLEVEMKCKDIKCTAIYARQSS